MQMSDAIDALAAALAEAQGEMKNPAKDKINQHFTSKYADLASTLDTSRPVLKKHGLSLLMFPRSEGGKVTTTPMLLHKSGQYIMGDGLEMLARDPGPQAIGSVITYARRYLGGGITAQAPDDDDDGNMASPPPPSPGRQVTARKGSPPPEPPPIPEDEIPFGAPRYVDTKDQQAQLEKMLAFERIDKVLWPTIRKSLTGKTFVPLIIEEVVKEVLAR